MTITERVYEVMRDNKLKATDLADMLGINKSSVSNWKSRNTNPPAEYIVPICKFLHVSAIWLLTGEGEMFEQEQPDPLPLVMNFEIDELDAEQKELLFMFAHLGDTGKYAVKDFARYQLETLPRNAPIERPKGAGKSSHLPPSSNANNSGEIA